VPLHNPQSIAEKTAVILGDQNLRARLGNSARQKIEEEFSWEKVIPRIIDVFKDVGSKQSRKDFKQ